ncbi:hypothetical protein COCNU_10G000060 [Cocos nucifera]|uniref:Uncharacterized protein n=1 Tax=Cocos nucifera TaxID=13894 RepID=A0A8K0ILC4_COCNU|nr:hypothetical protein COCNU_10G000060 [Cocos nucifera]
MDAEDTTPPAPLSSRPTLGFPLGTGLLLVVIFCLSGVFSCCYHWDKIRSLRRRLGRTSNPVQPADDHQHQHPPSSMGSPPAKLLFKLQVACRDRYRHFPLWDSGYVYLSRGRRIHLPSHEATVAICAEGWMTEFGAVGDPTVASRE